MNTEESTVGSVNASSAERRALAAKSLEYNLKDPIFVSVFGKNPLIHFETNDAILEAKSNMRQKALAKRNKVDCGKGEVEDPSSDLKEDTPLERSSTVGIASTSQEMASNERRDSSEVQSVFSLDLDCLKL